MTPPEIQAIRDALEAKITELQEENEKLMGAARIGQFTLRRIRIPTHIEDHIFLQRDCGEGMSVPESDVAEVINNFYNERF